MEIENVLSICNGMSCGNIVLDELGIEYKNMFTSEILKEALEVESLLFPSNKQLGDVYKLKSETLPKIDLLIGGTSCQNLSITVINNNKHNQGLEGVKSKLFYEFVRLKEELNPKYFMLENVASMKDKDRDIITEIMGVEPIMLDSALFGAQDRKRYFWTNIPIEKSPEDKGIVLQDKLFDSELIQEKYWYKEDFVYNGDDKKVQCTLDLKGHDILKRVYNLNNKCGTLTCVTGGHHQKKVYQDGRCRKIIPYEYGLLQNVPVDILDKMFELKICDTKMWSLFGNGWDIEVIKYIFKGLKEINT